MIKRLLFSIMLLLSSNKAFATPFLEQYNTLKQHLQNQYNINFGLDATYSIQKISNQTTSRKLINPYFKKALSNTKYGKTFLDFSFNIVRFSNTKPLDIAQKRHISTLFNNYDNDYNELYELYISHTMPNKYNWITLGLGQIPISKFDSPVASDLQHYYFLNSALAQNTTFTYPTAGIGAYTTLLLSKNLNLSLGSIDATNPLASGIHFKNFDKYSSFISVNYTPKLKNKYRGSYSLILYDKPSVEKAPFNSQGWSLYLAQDITNKHSLFLRLNGASSNYPIIKNSYSFGVLVTNPFNRQKNDKFGIAYSINKPNNTTSKEHIIETYYDYKLNSNISIRPDIQFYHHQKNNLVFSLSMQLEL